MNERNAAEILVAIRNECEQCESCWECMFFNRLSVKNIQESACILNSKQCPCDWKIDEVLNETT